MIQRVRSARSLPSASLTNRIRPESGTGSIGYGEVVRDTEHGYVEQLAGIIKALDSRQVGVSVHARVSRLCDAGILFRPRIVDIVGGELNQRDGRVFGRAVRSCTVMLLVESGRMRACMRTG